MKKLFFALFALTLAVGFLPAFAMADGPTASLKPASRTIVKGDSAALNWSSTQTSSCSGNGTDGSGATSGSTSVSPTSLGDHTYNLHCTGSNGSATPIEEDNQECTGTYLSSTVTDESGYGPGIISNHFLQYPVDALQNPLGNVPSGYATHPEQYCVELKQTTTYCGGSSAGTCVPNSSWHYEWYKGTGLGPQTQLPVYDYKGGGGLVEDYKDESWLFTPLQYPTVDDSATVTVAAAVTAKLTASPSSITSGNSSLLTWSSTGADSCVGDGFSTGTGKATSGSKSVSPTSKTTYTVTCTGAGGSNSDSATVNVTPGIALVSAALTLNGSTNLTVNSTDSVIANWTSQNADTCVATAGTGFSTGSGGPTSGSDPVTPPPGQSTAYTVKCTNALGSLSRSAWVTVNATNNNQNGNPTASCSASPTSGTASLPVIWSSSVSGGTAPYTYSWHDSAGHSGTSQNFSPAAYSAGTFTATLVVTDANNNSSGAVSCSPSAGVSVSAAPNSPPSCTLTPSYQELDYGNTASLTWSSSGADSCSGSPASFNTLLNGTKSGTGGVSPTTDTNYIFSCTNAYGSCNSGSGATAQVHVIAGNCSVSADNYLVQKNGIAKISWTVGNQNESCTVSDQHGNTLASGTHASGGPVSETVSSSTIYTISCTVPNTTYTCSDTKTVNIVPQFQEF